MQSRTFRNAPSSRRLLRYLADHSLAGDADQLKEYTIGVDAFGKPPDYDPRLDSTVRIQIGRLRLKLSEFYREEGTEDPLVVGLPKGRFSLICEPRPAALTAPEPSAAETEPVWDAAMELSRHRWRTVALVLAGTCLILIAALAFSYSRLRGADRSPTGADEWPPELAELWAPFVNTGRPLIVAVGNPLFLQFENKLLYRDPAVDKLEDLLKSPSLIAVRKALGVQQSQPVHYYAAVGDVTSAFLLGRRLGLRQPNISIVRSSQLQWQQLASANVLLLGPPRFFDDKLTSLPAPLEIAETPEGFRVVHPRPGEAPLYKYRDPPGFFVEDGEARVLITRSAGPVGDTDVLTFASNSTFGRAGALHAFTDAGFAHTLVAQMRDASGHIPRYFQVLLNVKFKGGVPTETSYLLYRELRRRN